MATTTAPAYETGSADGPTNGAGMTTGAEYGTPVADGRNRGYGRQNGYGAASQQNNVPAFPNVNTTIFLRPIAPPTVIGLSGFAIATFVIGAYLAGWFGDANSPLVFAPLLFVVGGLSQFIASFYCLWARDVLFSVIHVVWGGFFLSLGTVYFLVAAKDLPAHTVFAHFSEVGIWFVPISFFTWSMALGAFRRDWVTFFGIVFLAMGSSLTCSLLGYGSGGVHDGVKAAGYFYIFSAIIAWYRVTVFIAEEAYGETTGLIKAFPLFRTRRELDLAPVVPGYGEPGVQTGIQSLHKYEWQAQTKNYMVEKADMGVAHA